jgi:hypothetical protein
VTACDQGKQHDQPTGGPYLTIVGANIGTDKPLPADGIIHIAFDRFLLPITITRQSFQLKDAFGAPVGAPVITYDPVSRVVSLMNPGVQGTAWLQPNQPYKVEIGVPKTEGDSGPRAIDRATLDPAGGPYVIGFQVTALPSIPTPPMDVTMDFCRDVSPIFQAKCSGGPCHHAPVGRVDPAAGLILQTGAGVENTAIDRVAQASNTGPRAEPGPPGRLFGVDMAIIAPFAPDRSLLMYKVLMAQPRPEDVGIDASSPACTTDSPPPQPALAAWQLPAKPITDDERARLAELVLGREMPYPLNLPAGTQTPAGEETTLPLTFDELERLRAWIAQGAKVTTCLQCTE